MSPNRPACPAILPWPRTSSTGGIGIGTGTDIRAGIKGKVFCTKPSKTEIQDIQDIAPPLPYGIITRENQICVLYSGDWLKHWGRDILQTIRRHGSGLEWQCYLGSFIQCQMNKQRKPACAVCEFREECWEAAAIAGQRARRG